jgi:putative acetyltransferase
VATSKIAVREAGDGDLEAVLSVERAAFGTDEEADLVRELMDDASAEPALSLLAVEDDVAVGHVLFTAARLEPESPATVAILAPLAVAPERQGRGIGGLLVRKGLELLGERGVDLVFVLGHPAYYPRHGFRPAGAIGFDAPHPIPEEHADAWMVLELSPESLERFGGTVVCADTLARPEYWRE